MSAVAGDRENLSGQWEAARPARQRRGELREPGGHYAVTRVTEKLAMCAENCEKYVASVAH